MPRSPAEPAIYRWAGPDDRVGLAALLAEIKRHYHQPIDPPEAQEQAVAEWLKDRPGHCRFAVASHGDRLLGLATVAVVRPSTGLSGALYLKELFVSESARGTGLGRGLLGFLARYCQAESLDRIDLTTEDWNEGAIRFYEDLAARRQPQKIAFRFERDSLAALAEADNLDDNDI